MRLTMDRQTIAVGVGGAAVVGVAFGMARYAYGLTLPDIRSEFGLSHMFAGLIASGTFAGYLLALLSVPRLSARRGPRAPVRHQRLAGRRRLEAVTPVGHALVRPWSR